MASVLAVRRATGIYIQPSRLCRASAWAPCFAAAARDGVCHSPPLLPYLPPLHSSLCSLRYRHTFICRCSSFTLPVTMLTPPLDPVPGNQLHSKTKKEYCQCVNPSPKRASKLGSASWMTRGREPLSADVKAQVAIPCCRTMRPRNTKRRESSDHCHACYGTSCASNDERDTRPEHRSH